MKAPAFDYLPAQTVDEAVAALRAHGGDAKLLAGGQSLMPMLNFRLLAPSVLIDINNIAALDKIELREGELRAFAEEHDLDVLEHAQGEAGAPPTAVRQRLLARRRPVT